MKRCTITDTDRKMLDANKEEKNKQLLALNKDMEMMVATGHSKMLDETPFLPTGPRAYQLVET